MAQKKDDAELKAYMGEDAVFNGSLTFEGTVRIDGRFEGQVVTKDTLIIGESGRIIADINAGTIICKGKVEGNLIASQRIELHSASQVVGTVKTPSLFVEVGGILDGECDMSSQGNKVVELRKNEVVGTG
ncbi:MAG: polymer-forming cytoskeletal protein [Nitrospinae bacterium]|jgi:cytoskeletal protein CcmA (bactofilin family)|nr:polymer-forming cytoskeletal protein [Nitrospinota bacterium]MDA1109869.1 polymer-forming cytoskeletal protein [Nitrospinota bacterium]